MDAQQQFGAEGDRGPVVTGELGTAGGNTTLSLESVDAASATLRRQQSSSIEGGRATSPPAPQQPRLARRPARTQDSNDAHGPAAGGGRPDCRPHLNHGATPGSTVACLSEATVRWLLLTKPVRYDTVSQPIRLGSGSSRCPGPEAEWQQESPVGDQQDLMAVTAECAWRDSRHGAGAPRAVRMAGMRTAPWSGRAGTGRLPTPQPETWSRPPRRTPPPRTPARRWRTPSPRPGDRTDRPAHRQTPSRTRSTSAATAHSPSR
jgi:hypothetical protein